MYVCMYVCNYWSRHRPLKPLDGFDPVCMYIHSADAPKAPRGHMYACSRARTLQQSSSEQISELGPIQLRSTFDIVFAICMYVCRQIYM